MIDLEALKSRLANYDPAAPKCPLQIARFVNYAPDHITSLDAEYHDYDETTYVPCCRPEGHEGECRNARQVMGWPGFQTVSQLIAEVERLRYLLKKVTGIIPHDIAKATVFSQRGDLYAHKFRHEYADEAACGYRPRGPYQPLREEDLTCPDCIDVIRAVGLASENPERGEHRREENE
jgi:hypothetical protein